MVFRQVGNDTDNLISKFGLLNKSFLDIKRDFQNGQGIRSFGNVVKKEDIDNLKKFSNELKNGVSYSQAYKNNLSNSHTYIKKQGVAIGELYRQQSNLNKQLKAGKITQQEYDTQMSASKTRIQAITNQTETLTLKQKALSIASKATGVALNMAFNIGIALLINGIISLISQAVNYQKELAEKTKELGNTAKETTKDVSSLYTEYLKLNQAVTNGTGSKEDLKSATDNLLSSLGLEGIAVDELIKKYNSLEEAMSQTSLEKLKEAHNNLVSSVGTYKDELLKEGGNGFWGKKNTFTISNKDNDYLNFKDINDKGVIEALQSIKGLRYEIDAAEGASTDFVRHSFELLGDPKTVEGIKQNYETLVDMQDVLIAKFGSEQAGKMDIYTQITKRLDELKTAYENYTNEVTALNTNAAKTAVLENLKGKELPKTQEEFKAFYDNLINEATTTESELRNQFIGTEDEIKNSIKAAIEGMFVFDEFTTNPVPVEIPVLPSVSSDTSKLKSNLDSLKEQINDIFKNTDLFDKAIESLNKGEAIDFDSVMSMVEVDSSLAGKFIQTADGYTIAVNTLVNARQKYTEETRASIQADIESSKQTIKVAEQNIAEMQKTSDSIAYAATQDKGAYQRKKELDEAIQSEKGHIEELNNVIAEDTLILGEMENGVSSAKSSIEELSATLDTASKKQSLLKSAMEDMSETGYISASTYAELVELGGNFAECLEVQNGKLVLNIEKLKELESAEYDTAIAAKELEIAKWKAINGASLKGDFSNQKELEEMEREKAFLEQLRNEWNSTKPDNKKSSSNDKPKSVIDYEEWVAEQEHKIAMGQLKEDEAYYDEKLKRAEEAYSGLADYESDLWKVQEEVYKFREKLAQEAFDKEHDLFEKRVDDLEDYADKLSETSVTSDGTNLTTQEKWREVAAVYKEIQKEIDREINRIVQSGVEGNEKLLEELEKQWDKYADKISDTFKSAVEAEKSLLENQKSSLSDVYDKEIDKIKKQQEDSKNAADAEIDLIQEKIDNLKKVNDEKQSEYEIEKARQNLEKTGQRTRMTYGSDGTIIYKQDDEKIKEAQQNLDKLLLEKQVNTLESQKSLLEDMRDKESESYDKLIEDIESQKEQDERQFDILIQRLEDYLNPNNDTSNSDVWSEIAKMDGASYRNGKWVDKDGTEIDVAALLSKADEIVDSNNKVADSNSKAEDNVKADTANKKTGNKDKTSTDKDNVKKNIAKTDLKEIFKYLGISGNIVKNITLESLSGLSGISSVKPNATIINQPDVSKWTTQVQRNNNNSQTINMTFGDINVNNPVGDTKKLAEEVKGKIFREAMMQIPNDAMKIIHSNLR